MSPTKKSHPDYVITYKQHVKQTSLYLILPPLQSYPFTIFLFPTFEQEGLFQFRTS